MPANTELLMNDNILCLRYSSYLPEHICSWVGHNYRRDEAKEDWIQVTYLCPVWSQSGS
jgi:hypothetical protein